MRIVGLLLAAALVGTTLLVRHAQRADAAAILAAEDRTRTKIVALHDLSMRILARGSPHPGLEALLEQLPELGLEYVSRERWDPPPECEIARDDLYVYGLTDTTTRDAQTGERSFGYILRAWPREYGVTGDLEFEISDDGRLYGGQNREGRSDFDRGFPPAFPAPELATPEGEVMWWREPYR